ncbi:MAG: hypothetical protein KatS3mg105_3320 [Gemmatales bacterium]|nr:MAG: hypothetical protein KatS3mg105_3320 [Gemmatales bacterium]
MCTNTAVIMLAAFAGVLALLWRFGWLRPPNPLADRIDECVAKRKEEEMRAILRELANEASKEKP